MCPPTLLRAGSGLLQQTPPAVKGQVPRAAWVAYVHRKISRPQQVPLYPQGTLVPTHSLVPDPIKIPRKGLEQIRNVIQISISKCR